MQIEIPELQDVGLKFVGRVLLEFSKKYPGIHVNHITKIGISITRIALNEGVAILECDVVIYWNRQDIITFLGKVVLHDA